MKAEGAKVSKLILTSSSGMGLERVDIADLVICFSFRFVWGQLPAEEELASHLSARSDKHGPGSHWSDYVGRWRSSHEGRKDLGLLEFCEPYQTIELWFDPQPNDQLLLVWLLDYFGSHPKTAAKLRLALVDFDLIAAPRQGLDNWEVPSVRVKDHELQVGRAAWQAYRSKTPQACFDLLSTDLSALPVFRPCLLDLLDELPSTITGLGATEMRMLELIASGYASTNALFHLRRLHRRRVYGEWELGALLEGLALGPKPAVAGLGEELRTLEYENYRGRHEVYLRSRLSLTEFGWDVVAHKEDFSRHNPIHRWWGGTELTNDQLWRYAQVLMRP
jgi:hypothetical protein